MSDQQPLPKLAHRRGALVFRRLSFIALVAISAAVATSLMAEVTAAGGVTLLGVAVLGLFAVSFTWLAFSFWTSILGFLVCAANVIGIGLRAPSGTQLRERTAVIMPIYNEDTVRVAAGLEATLGELGRTGCGGQFDVFILSDTTRDSVAADELAAVTALRERHLGGPALYYRRRAENVGRKAGNVAEFVRRWGGRYAHMLVLDADSVMSGETIVALARLMEEHPEAGIIQTVPIPVNRDTLFARILQFASRLYGPITSAGLAFWSAGDGNYYGHNAIIRIAAFARHCGLPTLPGHAPLGGEILSHDFVEAALIRRAGFQVWIVPQLRGSYEELPANVIDYAKRDRRWSQGNLQHGRLLRFPGLKSISRLHLFMGVTSYIMSPVWLLLLSLSTADAIQRALTKPVYWKPGFNMFPAWPISPDFEMHLLLAITVATLFLPKLLGLLLVMFNRRERRRFGGIGCLVASMLLETIFSTLIAPVMMLFQTSFLLLTVRGRIVKWETQPRDDRGVAWREALARHWGHSLLALLWGGLVLWIVPGFLPWLLPVLTGLLVAAPVSAWSSRTALGQAAKRVGLFLTPEETAPPSELRRVRHALERGRGLLAADMSTAPAVERPASIRLVPAEHGLEMPHLAWPLGNSQVAVVYPPASD